MLKQKKRIPLNSVARDEAKKVKLAPLDLDNYDDSLTLCLPPESDRVDNLNL